MTGTTTPVPAPINPNLILQYLTPSDLTPAQVQARTDLVNALVTTVIESNVPLGDSVGYLGVAAREIERRAEQLFAAYEQQQFAAWEAAQTPAAPTPPAAAPIAPPPPTQQG